MANDTVRAIAATVAITGLFGVSGLLSERVQPALADPGGLTGAQQERLEKIASASLFGQFRTSLSDYLWLKADKYMHRGVELRGTTSEEKEKGEADEVTTHPDDAVAIKHTDETTVVPSKARDWRGHLGDIEREVSPYMDMSSHTHADARQTIPLFRLMTLSNPRFIKGYIVGATLIAAEKIHLDDAIAFLKEGEAANPLSIEIKTELGFYYTRKKKQYDVAMPYLYEALKLVTSRDSQTLNEDEMEAWQSAYRWAVLNRREAKDHKEARRLAEEGLRLFPDDVVCQGYLKQYPK